MTCFQDLFKICFINTLISTIIIVNTQSNVVIAKKSYKVVWMRNKKQQCKTTIIEDNTIVIQIITRLIYTSAITTTILWCNIKKNIIKRII